RNGSRFCCDCGMPLFAVTTPHAGMWERAGRGMVRAAPVGYGTSPPKRVGLAVLLAALFGPLGLLYSTVSGALYMVLAWCFLVLATCDDWIGSEVMVSMALAWPICIAWAGFAARSYNEDRR